MKILQYTTSFLPQVGGKEIVIHELVMALRALGHDVRVAVQGGWRRFRRATYPYPVYHLPVGLRSLRGQTQLIGLWGLTRAWRCDVLHAHNTFPAGYIATRLTRINRIPVIITPHGYDIQSISAIGHGMRLDPRKREKVDQAIRNATLLTAISDDIRATCEQIGTDGVPIVRIPNGINLQRFTRPPNPAIRRCYRIPTDAAVVLTVGNYFRRRGFEELIQALPAVLAMHPQAHLVIVGRDTQVLEPMIRSLGVTPHVTLTGPIALPKIDSMSGQDALADLYRQATIYVSAGMADGAEGLSLALLDAMAAGLAVVATRISGNRDVIEHEGTGILVPPGQHSELAAGISRLLGNDSLARRIGARAQAVAKQYAWPAVAEQYLAAYQQARLRSATTRDAPDPRA